jgi:hypothetical protein
MNVKLLRRVKRHILAEPSRLNMSVGLGPSDDAPRGTAGCIAGWTAILSLKFSHADVQECGMELQWSDVSSAATNALRLTADEALVLFDVRYWPAQFRESFHSAYFNDDKKRAQAAITAERIEYFITNLA